MNICMIVSVAFPPEEGIGFYTLNLSRYLISQGHKVQLITRGHPKKPYYERSDGLTIWRPNFYPVYPFHVHLHGWFVQRLVKNLEEEVDLFHCHSPLVPPLKTSRPIMLSFHSMVREDVKETKLNSGYTLLMKLQAPISYKLEVKNLMTASMVSVIAPWVSEALQNYPHRPHDIPVVWNGVETKIFTPKLGNHLRDGFILSVGRLGPGKGLEDLIEAISLMPKLKTATRLVIIGDGPLKHALETQVRALELTDRVHFEGYVSDRSRLIQFYQEASLFVLPSHHEGLPTVILEAMACGCPVLATSVGGVPNVIEDGVNGMLVPPKDPHQMAMVIQSMLADSSNLAEMGLRARQTIEQNFSWEKIGSKFIDLYSSLLSMEKDRHVS